MTLSTQRQPGSRRGPLQQQPRRGFEWAQQQQGSSEFQPLGPLGRRWGEDSEPDRDGHPRMAESRRSAGTVCRRAEMC